MSPLTRPSNLSRALFNREASQISDHAFRAAVYTAVVPSSTFVNITDVPNVSFRRFTPCGRFLVATAHNYRDVVVFRVETGGRRLARSLSERDTVQFENFAYGPFAPTDRAPLSDTRLHTPAPSRFSTPLFHDPTSVNTRNNPYPPSEGLLSQLPVPLIPPPTPATPQAHMLQAPHQRTSELLHSCSFARFFTKIYEAPVPMGADTLIREFCLVTQNARYLILASFLPRASENEGPLRDGEAPIPALATCPVLLNFTLHLVDVETGSVADRFTLYDDYVHLDGHASVHMLDDVLCVLSVRFQTVYVIKVQEALGRFTIEGTIGYHCRPDDVLAIAMVREAETAWKRRSSISKRARVWREQSGASGWSGRGATGNGGMGDLCDGNGGYNGNRLDSDGRLNGEEELQIRSGNAKDSVIDDDFQHGDERHGGEQDERDGSNETGGQRVPAEPPPTETGLGNGKLSSGFYTGLMQRLLVYVYRQYLREGKQSLFYRVVGQYSLLLMQKVQLLDGDHLLIRLGSYDRGGKVTDASVNTCFFVVYCISESVIINLFENRSTQLWDIFEVYRDQFIGDSAVAATFPPCRNFGGGSSSNRGNATGGGDVEHIGTADGEAFGGAGLRHGGSSRQTRRNRWAASSSSVTAGNRDRSFKRMRAMLSALPFSSQSRNVSPYLDRSLFSYNMDLLPALDGTKALSLREVKCFKFRSATTGSMRFKLAPSGFIISASDEADGDVPLNMGADDRVNDLIVRSLLKTKMLFLFHPHIPLVLSMEHGVNIGARLNIHVYGHDERR